MACARNRDPTDFSRIKLAVQPINPHPIDLSRIKGATSSPKMTIVFRFYLQSAKITVIMYFKWRVS